MSFKLFPSGSCVGARVFRTNSKLQIPNKFKIRNSKPWSARSSNVLEEKTSGRSYPWQTDKIWDPAALLFARRPVRPAVERLF